MAIHYFTDKVQVGGTPLSKDEVSELNRYFEENPEKPFRLYWFEEDDTDFSFLKDLRIKKLQVNYSKLANLDFLTYFPDLEEFDISEIRGDFDLSPVSKLSSLKVLNLDLRTTKKTADLSYIKDLSNLEALYLGGKFKKNSLQLNYEKLKVFCPHSGFDNFGELSKLKNLEVLKLFSQKVTSLEGVDSITTLKKVMLHQLKIEDQNVFSPVFRLPGLESLSIAYIKNITDFSFIKDESRLKTLSLWSLNGLESITGIEKLIALETYSHCGDHINKNSIDFSPLLKLKTLKNVEVKIGKMSGAAEEKLYSILNQFPETE